MQYGKYFSSFSYFCGLKNKMQNYEKREKYAILHERKCDN